MNVVFYPAPLSGAVRVPPSKSVAHRLLIAAALADEPTEIRLSALNRDIEATMACLEALGADIRRDGDILRIAPVRKPSRAVELDCGESGSTLRFLLPVAAALGARARFIGHGRLPERPNRVLADALRAHGARVDRDALPIDVQGPVSGGLWTLPGDVSSQYVTGLMFALPLLAEDSSIRLSTPLQSADYVNMTLEALRLFGIMIQKQSAGWQVGGDQRYRSPGSVEVEGDWSAAAFWLAANALGSSVRVDGLREDSSQGDRAVRALLGRPAIDAENVPDLVPALAVAAAGLPMRTVVTGAARLRLKESDRLATTAAMLKALGHRAEITPDGLIIEGGPPSDCPDVVRTVDGANDHRIVMAAAVAAAHADRPVRILGAQAVEKSYPDFFRDFARLGGRLDVEPSGQ